MADEHGRGLGSARANTLFLGFISLVLGGAALKLTAPVVLPFVIAVLLSFVLEPLVAALEKLRVPRVIGVLLAVLALAAGIAMVTYVLLSGGKTILTLYPKYEARFTEIYARAAELFQFKYDASRTLLQNLWDELGLAERFKALAISASQESLGFLTDAAMVILFAVFLLLELSHFRYRIGVAFAGERSERIQKIITGIMTQVARYLSGKFFLSLASGVLIGLLLAAVGMDLPVVWGLLTFILSFIPNIGSILSGGGITLFALVQFWPSPGPVILVLVVMVAVNTVLGNIVEPKVQGKSLGLSPFVLLVSLLAWGWLWGFAGMVLAVPMTVIVKIICENVPALEPVSIIMGSYGAAKRREKIRLNLLARLQSGEGRAGK